MVYKNTIFQNQGVLGKNNALTFDGASGFAVLPDGSNSFGLPDYRDILLGVVGTGTVIVYGSIQEAPVDFTKPSVLGNLYVKIALVDYSLVGAAAFYTGAAGVTVAGSTKIVELDTNLLTWVGFHRSATTVDAIVTETNAQ